MNTKKHTLAVPHMQRNILAGALVLTPVLVTWVVFNYLFDKLYELGKPWLPVVFKLIYQVSPDLAGWLFTPWVDYALAVVLSVALLYGLGWATTRVLGKQILTWFDAQLDRIPLVKSVYGSTKLLLEALQTKPEGAERVVLIDFPSSEMKTIGFVTRVLDDENTGAQLAAVYVPTSPNPTSGYMEIVPLDKVTPTDWTMDEAMRFLITGGATAPDSIPFMKAKGWRDLLR